MVLVSWNTFCINWQKLTKLTLPSCWKCSANEQGDLSVSVKFSAENWQQELSPTHGSRDLPPFGVAHLTGIAPTYIFIPINYTLTQCFPTKTQLTFQNKPLPSTLVEGFLFWSIGGLLLLGVYFFLEMLFPLLIQECWLSDLKTPSRAWC